MADFGVILLAAGASTRMQSPKQLLPYQGKSLIRHAVETAAASGAAGVVVVLGANAAQIRPALDGLAVEIVENESWSDGMGGSIQAGLRRASEYPWQGVILALADQPLVDAAALAGLFRQHQLTGKAIVTAEYAGTVGVPVFFARSAYPLLQQLNPAQGCKGVILAHEEIVERVACPEAAVDLDTPSDYAAVQQTTQRL